jgi:thiol:disulfide interchange protein/DsbC/DsbD-like thiol-disulfide interchange protein
VTRVCSLAVAALRLMALFTLYICAPALADTLPAPLHVSAVLRAETLTPAPSQTVTLAFVMTPQSGWHGYFENPGDAGFGMQLKWDLPAGVTAGKPRYPVPSTLLISGLMNYVYERPYTILVDVQIAPSIARGTKIPIKVRGDWLACTNKVCVPEGDDLSIDLVAGDGAVSAASRAQFDAYRAALPLPLDRAGRYAVKGKTLEIAVPYPATAPVKQPYFFAQTPDIIDYPVPQNARRSGDILIVTTGLRNTSTAELSGVLRYGDGQGLIVTARPGPVPMDGAPITNTNTANGTGAPASFAWILVLSVLGGLILNLMPCVFPILGLKAVSLAKMGGDTAAAKRDALAYTAGVILSIVALGGVMLALRSAGQQAGWAFQLQEPRMVMALLLLVTAITLNLAGVFEIASINVGASVNGRSGMAGSFGTGVLAAVVATQCTGPFMAAATGAALLLPVPAALLVFAGLGFGLALPYLAIAYVPVLRRLLPKPGPWLIKFKYVMAVPMALTLAALLWLLSRMSGGFGLGLGSVAVGILSFVLITIGKIQRRGLTARIWTGLALVCALAAVLILPRYPVATNTAQAGVLQAAPYSEAKLAQYRASGQPVFVYFTADWCVTCKVNEAAALNRPATAEAFQKAGVKVLVGDFTRRDPAIARALEAQGRSGVPLYLYYAKGGKAQVLPQVLTPQILIDTVR